MKNLKSEAQIKKLFGNIAQWLTEVYVLFYLCIFPLSIHDKYYDILVFRFALFWKPTLAYGVIFVIIGLLYLLCDTLYNEGAIRKRFFESLKAINVGTEARRIDGKNGSGTKNTDIKNSGLKSVKHKSGLLLKVQNLCKVLHITGTDIAFTVLILVFSISTAFAEYPYEAFWGDRGRNQGLLLWLMFYIAYILITRFYRYQKWHIYAFMGCWSLVCIWGICNFFMMTFGMLDGTDDIYAYTFVSSIGNINTYNNFTAIFYGVAASAFVLAKKPFEYIYTFVMLLIVSFAQIMGKSDNAVLSTAAVWMVIPLVLIKNWKQLSGFFIVMFMYVLSVKVTAVLASQDFPTMNDADPSIVIELGKKGFMNIIVVLMFLLVVAAAVYSSKAKEMSAAALKRVRSVWISLILLGITGVIVILILANTGVHSEIWEPYRNILIFNEEWGTVRGLNWKLAMTYWTTDATLFSKIFGYGPDTYYIITMDRFMDLMWAKGYGFFDSAHNEYLEYFITVGIAGLIAYLTFLCTSVKAMFKSKKNVPMMIAVGVIAYALQAVVNIAIPITTPVLMILMFVGLSIL